MPIFLDGTIIWTDCNSSFSLQYEPLVLYGHLAHIHLLLNDSCEQKSTGLWMPCGDIFPDATVVKYRLTEFGGRFLVMTKNETELVIPVTNQLLEQVQLLIKECIK